MLRKLSFRPLRRKFRRKSALLFASRRAFSLLTRRSINHPRLSRPFSRVVSLSPYSQAIRLARRNMQTSEFGRDSELDEKTTIFFGVHDHPGALNEALSVFSGMDINISRIESSITQRASEATLKACLDLSPGNHRVRQLTEALQARSRFVHILPPTEVPWFPVTDREVDSLALLVLQGGTDLINEDHPGFNDPVYIQRRDEIAKFAESFQYGDAPRRMEYSPEENECWGIIWRKLQPLLKEHACDEYLECFNELQKKAGFSEKEVPQLSELSEIIQSRTGFRLRPTAGLISSRYFLNGLAFNVFFCTQYLRHPGQPLFTPEPDVVHELIGHAPLFANPEFARFSQAIGLASIGASDEDIVRLARCYWFSIEFGLCSKSPGSSERKAYGAGVLSSFGEIAYAMSEEPEIRPWDPWKAAEQTFPITTYQPIYFLADSFADAKEKLEDFSGSLNRPFSVKYDDNKRRLMVDRNVIRTAQDTEDRGGYGE